MSAALAVLTLVLAMIADVPALWGGLEPGAYGVGYAVEHVRDATRALPATGGPRPVQVVVWYPAGSPSGPRGRFRDYVALTAGERLTRPATRAEADSAVAALRSFMVGNGVDSSALARWLASPVAAARNAPPAPGRFPIVLLAQGNFEAPYHQALLAEYLAAHGYVVATTPSQTRIAGPIADDSEVLASARDQAADLRLAARVAAGRADADTSRLALVGHSFGARSALVLLLQDLAAGAFVSLDGGIGSAAGGDWLARWPDPPLRRVRAPVLHFFERVDAMMTPDFSLLERLTGSDRCLVELRGMHHLHFTSLGPASAVIPGFAVGPATPDMLVRWRALARGTLRYLDASMAGRGPPACPPADSTGGEVRHLPAD